MKKDSSGFGASGLWILAVVLFLASRLLYPSMTKVLYFIGAMIVISLLALVGVTLFFAFRKPQNGTVNGKSKEEAAMLSKGKEQLMELRRLSMEVKNSSIRSLSTEICGSIDRIFRTLKEQPENISGARKFLNYYLPTLAAILRKYSNLEKSGIPAEEITENVIHCLKDIKRAMEKQYTQLFDDDILDLSVEMDTLIQICKRDGLLAEDDFKSE